MKQILRLKKNGDIFGIEFRIGHFTVMDGSEAEGACFDTNLPVLSCKSIYSYAY